MSYREILQRRAVADFQQRIDEGHAVEILRDDGLYRHLKCTKNGSQVYRFDLITWPGYLAVTGDMGDYSWSRVPDMFSFVRSSIRSASYFTEKLQSGPVAGIKEYTSELFDELIAELIANCEEFEDGETQAQLKELEAPETMQEAAELLYNTDYQDVAEHFCSLETYNYHYRWILQAVEWAVAEYDRIASPSQGGETSEREEKYRIALENIKAHQEVAGGSIAQHTAVWNIANNVLQGGE